MEPLLRDFFEHDNNDQNLLTRKIFSSYKDFEVEFKVVFKKVDEKKIAKRQFVKFKQTGSALYYTV